MGTYVYVGNLGARTTESMVREAFSAAGGRIGNVVILRSPRNDRSRGFGFVELDSENEALVAIQTMNGVEIEGRPIKVSSARDRAPEPSQRAGFQSYGGGGPRRPAGGKRKRRT